MAVIFGTSGNDTRPGTDESDAIYGLGGNDSLGGALGRDTIRGGEGDDTVRSSSSLSDLNGDLLYGDAGNDLVVGGIGADNLSGGVGDDALYALGGRDTLDGGDGNDTLAGGALADTIYGGDGTDRVYYRGSLSGVTVNLARGIGLHGDADGDRLFDIDDIEASDKADSLTGSDGDNALFGLDGDDTIYGLDGDDTLDGGRRVNDGAGANRLIGGDGDDLYRLYHVADKAIERAREGIDSVEAAFTLTLGANVEHLTLIGSGAIDGTGNGLANWIVGTSGANVLDGRGGRDTMEGGAGNDIYVVDNSGDRVVEIAGGGVDRIRSTVSLTLSDTVENLDLRGSADLRGTGTNGPNALNGNAGDNVLRGLAGFDILNGGKGQDTLVGGTQMDFFVFDTAPAAANRDTITDFNTAEDFILLDRPTFYRIAVEGTGNLAAESFATGRATEADDRIIYNPATGSLVYDTNGNAAGGAVTFAMLSRGLDLSAADFLVTG